MTALVTETMPADIRAAESEHEFLAPAAPISGEWGESRRFPRYECRSCIDVVVHPPANEPSQQSQACQVLTRDISRGGMNILHKAADVSRSARRSDFAQRPRATDGNHVVPPSGSRLFHVRLPVRANGRQRTPAGG